MKTKLLTGPLILEFKKRLLVHYLESILDKAVSYKQLKPLVKGFWRLSDEISELEK